MNSLEQNSLCIDLDGTLAEITDDYSSAPPIPGAADALRTLKFNGWKIIIFTARHFNHWEITTRWLNDNHFEYDQLVFGKPTARFYIDDRGINFNGDWDSTVTKLISTTQ